MDIKWKKAKAGTRFSGDTIAIPIGIDDHDARLVRMAVYDCIYIPVSELRELPVEESVKQ